MKDAYKRRQKEELEVPKTDISIDHDPITAPTHQERLVSTGGSVFSINVHGNNLIAISSTEWSLVLYELNNSNDENSSILSDVSIPGEEARELNEVRPIWRKIPKFVPPISEPFRLNKALFLNEEVVACTDYGGGIFIWCVRSAVLLDRLTLRNVELGIALSKVDDVELVAGSLEGHVCFFSHNDGLNLKESKRIWKAHQATINDIVVYDGTIVSASEDCSVRLWDAASKNRIAVLHHNEPVFSVDISERYVISSSGRASLGRRREMRVYANRVGYPLVHIFFVPGLWKPRILRSGCVSCFSWDGERFYCVFFDIERGCVLGRLIIACNAVVDYDFLADGRIVFGGNGSCRAVVVTLPRRLRRLVAPKTNASRGCTVM